MSIETAPILPASSVALGMPTIRTESGPSEPFVNDVSCDTCPAVCCSSGTVLDLTPSEAEFMAQGGTVLEELGPPSEPRKKGVWPFRTEVALASYALRTKCAYLQESPDGSRRCAVYTAKSRPQVCGSFKEGGIVCRSLRLARGVDTIDQWDTYWEATIQKT